MTRRSLLVLFALVAAACAIAPPLTNPDSPRFDREAPPAYRVKLQTSRGPVSTDLVDTIAVRTRPFVTTGFKAYISDRAFFRGDVKLDFGSRVEQVVWRAGFGVDL